MSITRDSNSTNKLEVDGALILLPSLHPCSVLRVFKANYSYMERKEVETRMRGHLEIELGISPIEGRAVTN